MKNNYGHIDFLRKENISMCLLTYPSIYMYRGYNICLEIGNYYHK